MTNKLRAQQVTDKLFRLYSGNKQVGSVVCNFYDATWASFVGTGISYGPYQKETYITAAGAAKARWGVAGRDAVIDAMLAAENAS